MAIVSNTVGYFDEGVLLEAFFAYDDEIIDRQRPAVLVSHAWCGRNEFVDEKAKRLAELGYVGFAIDMYGKGILGSSVDENSKLMQPFINDRKMLQKRINAGLNAVKLLPWVDDCAIAAIGYCFGGLCVLDLARSGADIKGVVSFHGLLNAPEQGQERNIQTKVIAFNGYDDPMVTINQVNDFQKELALAGADWQFHCYGNTMHAFTNPLANDPDFGTVFQPDADQRSWLAMKNFLEEIFTN